MSAAPELRRLVKPLRARENLLAVHLNRWF